MKTNFNINKLEDISANLSIIEGLEEALSDSLDLIFSRVPNKNEKNIQSIDVYSTFYELRRDQNKIFSLIATTSNIVKTNHKLLDDEINDYYIE